MFLDYDRRVKRGIKFLDKHLGRDVWIHRIITADLDVRRADSCPLAQATLLPYFSAARQLKIDSRKATGWRRGRAIWLGFLNEDRDYSDRLNDEWVKQVSALQVRELVDW
jgi:hypothetical protein